MDFDFDAGHDPTPRCEPVKYGGKDYWVHEATEDAHVAWQNARNKGAKLGDDGKVVIGEIANGEPVLVSRCLFRPGPDGVMPRLESGAPNPAYGVPEPVVRGWPPRVVTKLFDWIMKVSELNAPVQADTVDSLKLSIAELQSKLAAIQGNGSSASAPS